MPEMNTEPTDIAALNPGDRLWWGGELTSKVHEAVALDSTTGVIIHLWEGGGDSQPVRTQMPRVLKVNRVIIEGE